MTDRQQPGESVTSSNGSETPESPAVSAPGTNGVTPVEPAASTEDEPNEKQASPELKRFWEAVKHLPVYAKLATAIMRDPEVPRQAKVALGLGGGYAISPVDLVPGIIPVAGQMDDLYAMLVALQQSLKRMPEDIAQKHLEAVDVPREQIDNDLAAVRDLAKLAVVKSLKFGGKALGRLSRAAINIANNQLERRNARRGETTL